MGFAMVKPRHEQNNEKIRQNRRRKKGIKQREKGGGGRGGNVTRGRCSREEEGRMRDYTEMV